MKLRLPGEQVRALRQALERAGTNEIGGQMYGEQIAPSDFRVSEITFQSRPGTLARFVVDLVQAARDALRFFERTERRYTRFNYIGEWHSHPSFAVQPSATDVATMRELVRDGGCGFRGNFAVLLIVRLDVDTAGEGTGDVTGVACGGWLFDPQGAEQTVTIQLEND